MYTVAKAFPDMRSYLKCHQVWTYTAISACVIFSFEAFDLALVLKHAVHNLIQKGGQALT